MVTSIYNWTPAFAFGCLALACVVYSLGMALWKEQKICTGLANDYKALQKRHKELTDHEQHVTRVLFMTIDALDTPKSAELAPLYRCCSLALSTAVEALRTRNNPSVLPPSRRAGDRGLFEIIDTKIAMSFTSKEFAEFVAAHKMAKLNSEGQDA